MEDTRVHGWVDSCFFHLLQSIDDFLCTQGSVPWAHCHDTAGYIKYRHFHHSEAKQLLETFVSLVDTVSAAMKALNSENAQ